MAGDLVVRFSNLLIHRRRQAPFLRLQKSGRREYHVPPPSWLPSRVQEGTCGKCAPSRGQARRYTFTMPAMGGSKSGAPKPGMKRKRVAEPVVSQEDDKRVVAAGLAAGAGVHTVHLPTADGYTDVYVSRVRDAPLHLVLYTHRPPLSSVEWASVLDRALEGGWHVVSSGNASALVHDAVDAAHGPASTAGDGALPPLYYTRIRVEDEADAARVLRLPSEFPDTDASGLLLGLKGMC
ncbi:hypothetical protein EON67_08520 [archaeon]|nr:MAG: hypothetical protein EON67_08520 [archaeon]